MKYIFIYMFMYLSLFHGIYKTSTGKQKNKAVFAQNV